MSEKTGAAWMAVGRILTCPHPVQECGTKRAPRCRYRVAYEERWEDTQTFRDRLDDEKARQASPPGLLRESGDES